MKVWSIRHCKPFVKVVVIWGGWLNCHRPFFFGIDMLKKIKEWWNWEKPKYGSPEWWLGVGNRIKKCRERRGLSLMELSLICNLWDLEVLRAFEEGCPSCLKPDPINELCDKLKCSPEYLLFDVVY